MIPPAFAEIRPVNFGPLSKSGTCEFGPTQIDTIRYDTIRHDTIAEFNVDSKAEYSALYSTRSQKKKLKQTTPVPL